VRAADLSELERRVARGRRTGTGGRPRVEGPAHGAGRALAGFSMVGHDLDERSGQSVLQKLRHPQMGDAPEQKNGVLSNADTSQ